MRYCVECGAAVQVDWKHCASCGASLEALLGATHSMGDDERAAGQSHGSWFRRRRKGLAIAGLVVLALLVLGVVDWFVRNNELSALVSADDRAEEPLLDFDSALEECADRDEDCAYKAAAKHLARTLAGMDRIADVRVLPWHGQVQKAKDRVLAHYEAWEQLMRDFASDRFRQTEVRYSEISATFKSARRAYLDAIPRLALFKLDARIDNLFPP